MRGPIFVLCLATALPQPFGLNGIESRRSVRGPSADGIAVRAPLHAFTFHHLHLNDPRSSFLLEFYERLFDPATTRRLRWGGAQGLQSGPMRLLISHGPLVREAPTAIWHFGWGGVSLGETYLAHARRDVAWEPPLPADLLHVHLRSVAPAVAAAWYRDVLGSRVSLANVDRPAEGLVPPEQRIAEALAWVGDTPLLIYPSEPPLFSTRGQRADHLAIACPDFDAALERLKGQGVAVVAEAGVTADTRTAMIEGPDHIAIELVEIK